MKYKAVIRVDYEEGVPDNRGRLLREQVNNSYREIISDLEYSKKFTIKIKGDSISKALERIEEMSKDLLANSVVEKHRVLSIEEIT